MTKRKPSILKRYRPSAHELIAEFRAGATIKELGLKYKFAPESIKQFMFTNKKEYEKAAKIAKEEKQRIKYAAFLEVVIKLGRIPGTAEMRKYARMSNTTYYSLRAKAENEGYIYKPYMINSKDKPARQQEMLQWLKDLAKLLNHTPCSRELDAAGKWYAELYSKYFGSLTNAQKLAGLTPNKKGNPNLHLYQKKKSAIENL